MHSAHADAEGRLGLSIRLICSWLVAMASVSCIWVTPASWRRSARSITDPVLLGCYITFQAYRTKMGGAERRLPYSQFTVGKGTGQSRGLTVGRGLPAAYRSAIRSGGI